MAHESAGKGIFMTTSTFTDDAKKFAADHSDKLFLIDGQRFIAMIEMLPKEKKVKLLVVATEGDYTTPTCASCGIKMVWRSGKAGDFWGCQNYPRCKSLLKIAIV
jgi:restriction system protein